MGIEFDVEGLFERLDHSAFTIDALDGDMSSVYRFGAPPVSIAEFIADDYFMGKVARDLYADNIPDLLDIFHPSNNYIEIVLTGATSIGKTFLTAIAMTYVIYTILSYNDPHRILGGSSASPIVIINMSVNAQKAREVIFTRIKTMVDMSPFFREKLPRDMRLVDSLVWRTSTDADDIKKRTGSQILYKPGTADSLSALGDDIYAGIGDELNFFRVIEKSKRSYGETYDPAQKLYDTISRRMKGRFSAGGLPLGKFFLLSSAQYPDDFIERRIAEAEADGSLGETVKVIRKSLWEAKRGVFIAGRPVFGEKTFRVEVGSSRRGSRLLDTFDRQTSSVTFRSFSDIEGKVLEVPVELYDDFFRDVEGAVRDFGGEVTRAILPFFPDTGPIFDAVSDEIAHPWSSLTTTLVDGSELLVDVLFARDEKTGRTTTRRAPGRLRYAHVDLAETQDSAALSVVHVGGWRRVRRVGQEYDEPVFETDLMLRIVPPRGGEIQFSRIRDVLYQLRGLGMSFGAVTYDSFQSTDSIQQLSSRGYRAETLSVDREVAPYEYLKEAFFDGRMVVYEYEPLTTELARLERRERKIDHPVGGSKDVADTLAAAVWRAHVDAARLGDADVAARLPQTSSSRAATMLESRAERMRRLRRSLEDEARDFLGGARIVRR